jgi:hypothetical protein
MHYWFGIPQSMYSHHLRIASHTRIHTRIALDGKCWFTKGSMLRAIHNDRSSRGFPTSWPFVLTPKSTWFLTSRADLPLVNVLADTVANTPK